MKRRLFKQDTVDSSPRYQARARFMNEKEVAAYDVLTEIFGTDIRIFAKVWLADLVAPVKPQPEHLTHWRRIQRRRVDFLVCAGCTFEPILAFRLETEAYSRRRRLRGSDVLDEVLEDIGLPLLRLVPQYHYKADELIKKINFTIQETSQDRSYTSQVSQNQTRRRLRRNTLQTAP